MSLGGSSPYTGTDKTNKNKIYINEPEKVATTRTEDGHKLNTKTSITMQTKRTKEHRTTEEEMKGPTPL